MGCKNTQEVDLGLENGTSFTAGCVILGGGNLSYMVVKLENETEITKMVIKDSDLLETVSIEGGACSAATEVVFKTRVDVLCLARNKIERKLLLLLQGTMKSMSPNTAFSVEQT